jgi:uncharacterized integral membrane protein
MKSLAILLTSLLVTVWVVAIAIISVQNAAPVSLRFLTFRSIDLPLGLLLAFCTAFGIISMALLQPLWGIADAGQSSSRSNDDAEFFVDDEDF